MIKDKSAKLFMALFPSNAPSTTKPAGQSAPLDNCEYVRLHLSPPFSYKPIPCDVRFCSVTDDKYRYLIPPNNLAPINLSY